MEINSNYLLYKYKVASLSKTSLYKRIVEENNFDFAIPNSHLIQLSLDIIYKELQELKEEVQKIKNEKNNK